MSLTKVSYSMINGAPVNVKDFGAVAGTGQSNTVRTANTAAINAAFATVKNNGALYIGDGPFEVNGELLFGSNTPESEKTMSVFGNADDKSQIISYATGNVIDASGSGNITFSGFRIESNTAEVGLLLSRTGSTYETSSSGAFNTLENVYIHGSFSIAAFATLASEVLRVRGCTFWNTADDAKSYATSKDAATLGITSTYTLPPANQNWTTNTDLRFSQCTFWAAGLGQTNVWMESQFDGTFDSCLFITQNATSASLNRLVGFISNYGGLFNGGCNITNSLFETGYGFALDFQYVGSAGAYYDINISDNTFLTFGSSAKLFNWGSAADQTLFKFNWYSNTYRPQVDITFENVIELPFFAQYATIEAPTYTLLTQGDLQYCNINVASIYSGSSGQYIQSVVSVAERTLYGAGPSVSGLVPSGYTQDKMSKLTFGPTVEFATSPTTGEMQTVDSGYGNGFPSASTTAGRAFMGFYDGVDWRALGAYPGTPASAVASGKAGTILYDSSYLYVCTASNTWKRVGISSW